MILCTGFSEKINGDKKEQTIMSMMKNVPDHEQLEKALRDSEEKYRVLFNQSSIGIYLHDMDGRILDVNRHACRQIGYSNHELLKLTIFDLHPNVTSTKNLPKSRIKELWCQWQPGQRHTYEGEHKHKDGTVFPIEISTGIVEYGGAQKILAMIQDIKERKQMEDSLRESEKKYRELANSLPQVIFEMDENATLTYANNNAFNFLKYSHDDLKKGLNALDILRPEDRDRAIETLQKRANGEEVANEEYTIVKKDGTTVPVEIHTNPIVRENSPLCYRGIMIDLTERKQAEEERKRLEVQLMQAQKLEAIGTLAGGVAHDLNNILSGIINYPELMLIDLPEDSHLRKPLLTIKNSGKKAAAIVNDLLTLARRGVKIDTIVNLGEIINEYLASPECKQLRSHHPEVTIETDFDDRLLSIKGSRVHLSKTVMNLVANAAEAIPGNGKINIQVKNKYIDHLIGNYEQVAKGDYVVLTVADNGVGIREDDLGRIFEPFYTRKKMGKSGTGLGMAVVWGTVKDHMGYIDVVSKIGDGSRFTIYFPGIRTAGSIEKKENFSIEHFMGNGESVLIVDDIEEQREIAASMAEKLGYHSESVSSGEAAIEHLKHNEVDIMLLDMIMDPGIDGLETYKHAHKHFPDLKVVIASGFTKSNKVSEAQRLGAGAYLKKPYTLKSLAKAIRKELDT